MIEQTHRNYDKIDGPPVGNHFKASPMPPAPWLLARWLFVVWFCLLHALRVLARWFLDVSFLAFFLKQL